MSRILLAGLLAAGFLPFCGCGSTAGTGTGTVVGKWNISEHTLDGVNQTTEDWTITAQNGQFVLTSAVGSTTGTATANGASFTWQGQDPTLTNMGVNNILQLDIECYVKADGSMYGTKVITRYVANGLGQMDPTPSTESWEFVAMPE